MRRGSLVIAGVATLAFGGCAALVREQAASKAPEPEPWCATASSRSTAGKPDPLSDLGEQFRAAYQRARANACRQLASGGLVIRYAYGTVEARWNGTDLGPPVVLFTPYVHALKSVSHAVFLTALLFDEPAGAERDAHVAAALEDVEALWRALADPSSPTAKLFPSDELPRQIEILALTSAALRAPDHDYFSAVRAPLNENLRRASAAVLTLLHRTIEGYRREVAAKDPAAWDSLVVVAAVAHQARAREVAVQYFERLLGETISEGASREERLVIVEGPLEAGAQRGALAAHRVDRGYASTIFGDAGRLQVDVMADSGGLLDQLLPARARVSSP